MGHNKFKLPSPTSLARKNRAKLRTVKAREALETQRQAAEVAESEQKTVEALLVMADSNFDMPMQSSADTESINPFVDYEIQTCNTVDHIKGIPDDIN